MGYYCAGGRFALLPSSGFVPTAFESEKVVPVLLLGIDKRHPDEPSRSDTIIVAFLDQKEKVVRLLSVPRDTYAFVPGRSGKDKINVAHALGGAEATAKAVSDLLGIDIKYYVETDFEGFEKIIDTLGGITIDVDQRMYYPAEGIDLYPGVQHLNGHDALAYVRYRNYPLGDIDRIKHQQKFFSAVADEVLKWQNVWRIPDLVSELTDAIKTNLGTAQIIKFARLFKNIDKSHIETYMVPGEPQMMDGISYWVPDTAEARFLAASLIEGVSPQDSQGGQQSPEESESSALPVASDAD